MALSLILVPLVMAAAAFLCPSGRVRPWLVLLGGAAHLILTGTTLFGWDEPVEAFDKWLVLDPLGKLVLAVIRALFFLCAPSPPGSLPLPPARPNRLLCTSLPPAP